MEDKYKYDGVMMAIEYYEELYLMNDMRRDVTKNIYAKLNKAIDRCGLTDAQYKALYHTYIKQNPTHSDRGIAEILGIRYQSFQSALAATYYKIYAYMNGERRC